MVEAPGTFRERDRAGAHLRDSVRKVLVTANGRNEAWTVLCGVNHREYDLASHHIISAGSCTTNCVALVAMAIHDAFGIRHAMLTTVHSTRATRT